MFLPAIGYAEQSGIPYGNGPGQERLCGAYLHSAFADYRQLGIRLKLNPAQSVVAGKRLIVIDDSIVRGNTQRA